MLTQRNSIRSGSWEIILSPTLVERFLDMEGGFVSVIIVLFVRRAHGAINPPPSLRYFCRSGDPHCANISVARLCHVVGRA